MLIVVAPALMAASTQRHKKSISVRVPSSADHSTSATWLRARLTCAVTMASTSSGDFCNLYFMCRGEVETNVWMRGRTAWRTASAQRSISLNAARARPATEARLTLLAMAETASKSPSDAMGKPASMTSTPSASSRSATSSFSSKVMVAPGDCSPSRRVVSKMMTRFLLVADSAGDWLDMISFLTGRPAGSGAGECSAGFQTPERPGKARPALRGD